MKLPIKMRARLNDPLQRTFVQGEPVGVAGQPTRTAASLRGLLARPGKSLSVDGMNAGVAVYLELKNRSK